MRNVLTRLSSRKFLAALAVEAAAMAALFWPDHASALNEAAVRLAALAAMVLTALGYGQIESAVDKAKDQG